MLLNHVISGGELPHDQSSLFLGAGGGRHYLHAMEIYQLSIYIAIVIPVLSYDIDSRSFRVCTAIDRRALLRYL